MLIEKEGGMGVMKPHAVPHTFSKIAQVGGGEPEILWLFVLFLSTATSSDNSATAPPEILIIRCGHIPHKKSFSINKYSSNFGICVWSIKNISRFVKI